MADIKIKTKIKAYSKLDKTIDLNIIDDAPIDNNIYGRKQGEWVDINNELGLNIPGIQSHINNILNGNEIVGTSKNYDVTEGNIKEKFDTLDNELVKIKDGSTKVNTSKNYDVTEGNIKEKFDEVENKLEEISLTKNGDLLNFTNSNGQETAFRAGNDPDNKTVVLDSDNKLHVQGISKETINNSTSILTDAEGNILITNNNLTDKSFIKLSTNKIEAYSAKKISPSKIGLFELDENGINVNNITVNNKKIALKEDLDIEAENRINADNEVKNLIPTNLKNGSGLNSLEQLSDKENFGPSYDTTTQDGNDYETGANAKCSIILGGPNYIGPNAGRSAAIGGYNVVLSKNSVVEGEANKSEASARASHTEGEQNLNDGAFSHVEGNYNETHGQSAHAEGSHTKANAKGSHAEGDTTIANGEYSHAEGSYTETAKRFDHAEGYNTVAGREIAIPDEPTPSTPGTGSGSDIQGVFNITSANTTITLQNLTGITSISWGDGTVDNSLSHTYTSVGKYNFVIKGVTNIRYEAFLNCTSLTNITIPNSVTIIEFRAFQNCTSLTSVTIGNGVTRIDEFAFRNCSSLTKIYFNGTQNEFNNITIEESNNEFINATKYYLGSGTGSGTTTPPTDLPPTSSMAHSEGYYTNACGVASHAQGYKTQAKGLASDASGYHTKAVNKAQTVVGKYNIGKTDTLFEVGNGIDEQHRSNAFEVKENGTIIAPGLQRVIDVQINGVSQVNNNTVNLQFPTAKGLTYEDTPNGRVITTAYANTSEINEGTDKYKPITSYYVNTAVKKALAGTNKMSLSTAEKELAQQTLGITNTDERQIAYDTDIQGVFNITTANTTITLQTLTGMTSISWGDGTVNNSLSHTYTATGKYNFVIKGATSIGQTAFFNCTPLTSIKMPNSVTIIGDSAFSNCHSLTSITIPDSVTSIGSSVFYNCSSLTSITIPNSLTSIGSYAFEYCSSLTSITIPNSVTSLGKYALAHCSKLTSITIPNSVTNVSQAMFWGCSSLTSVTIPNSVTSIGMDAFINCNALAKVYFNGTQSEFNNITVSTGNEKFTSTTKYYLASDGSGSALYRHVINLNGLVVHEGQDEGIDFDFEFNSPKSTGYSLDELWALDPSPITMYEHNSIVQHRCIMFDSTGGRKVLMLGDYDEYFLDNVSIFDHVKQMQ